MIPEAASPYISKAKASSIESVKNKFTIPGNYLLTVGIAPRKNIDRILEAHKKIMKETNIALVLVGHPYVPIKPGRNVYVLGHVTDEEIAALYTGASAFVYPSLYEGFGLPILDAFTCGAPVVTSARGSMKEVAGDGAILVDPLSTPSITKGIQTALLDKSIWKASGFARVKQFSWTKTAHKTLGVYEEAS